MKECKILVKEELPDKTNSPAQTKVFPATQMGRTPNHCYVLVQETPKQSSTQMTLKKKSKTSGNKVAPK